MRARRDERLDPIKLKLVSCGSAATGFSHDGDDSQLTQFGQGALHLPEAQVGVSRERFLRRKAAPAMIIGELGEFLEHALGVGRADPGSPDEADDVETHHRTSFPEAHKISVKSV